MRGGGAAIRRIIAYSGLCWSPQISETTICRNIQEHWREMVVTFWNSSACLADMDHIGHARLVVKQ